MATIEFGSFTNVSSGSVYLRTVVALPTGRACSDGVNRAGINGLASWLRSVSGADISFQLQFGSALSSVFSGGGGGGSTPGYTNIVSTNLWLVNGGSASFYLHLGGEAYFYRSPNGTGQTWDSSEVNPWTGVLRGQYRRLLPCLKPIINNPSSSADGTTATVSWTAPSDTGDTPITGYNVQRATNSSFTTGVQTISRTAGQLSATFTGLTPGVTYYYRVTAKNAVTDAASVLGGQWSDTKMLTQTAPAGLGRQYRSSTFTANDGRRWSGSAWQAIEGRRWSGTTWENLGH